MRTLMRLTSVSSAALFAAALWAAPAAAEESAPANTDDPMTIVVSLPNQRATIYRGTSVITSTAVSTGKRGYATKAGVYSILEKRRRHYSNLYNGAPMPWMQRLTWTGTALHAGAIPGYPASHGCIRLPYSFAPKLFKMTQVGAQVVVAHSAVEPKPISHAALFQPLPPPMPPELLTQGTPAVKPMRKSSNEASPARPFRLPVVFAKAEGVTPRSVEATASTKLDLAPETTGSIPQAQTAELPHSLDDTTHHAIDPSAAPFVGSGSHAVAAKTSAEAGDQIAAVETSDDFMKHQDRLIDRGAPKDQDRLARADKPAASKKSEAEAANVRPQAIKSASVAPDVAGPASANGDPIAELVSETAAETEQADAETLAMAADTLEPEAQQPLSVSLSVLGINDHPPLPLERPSAMMSRLKAGARAAAVEAADPISQEPLRILVTRRTTRDRTVDLQYILSDMGYLEPQNFDGTRGPATIRALKAFQKDNEMPVTGAFTDDVFKKVYEVAGKEEPAEGQLFVRQKFASVFSTPVSFSNPEKPLGTHLFTIMHFEPGATQAEWTAISLNDEETAETVLDRIEIPDDVRQRISERLTPGSSLIVADTAINSAALPKGADFLVWDTSKGATVQRASTSPSRQVRQRTTTRRPSYTRERSRSRYSSRRASPRRGFFQF
jgi:peptidoglycan hydrolase-like protein with peptidoglycan-binding domain